MSTNASTIEIKNTRRGHYRSKGEGYLSVQGQPGRETVRVYLTSEEGGPSVGMLLNRTDAAFLLRRLQELVGK